MSEYVEYLKEEHLKYIEEERMRVEQLAELESAEVEDTVAEIEGIVADITQNIDKIIEEVDDSSYEECMGYYRRKQELHGHRLEELGQEMRPMVCTSGEYVEEKLQEFKEMIDELTGIRSSKME